MMLRNSPPSLAKRKRKSARRSNLAVMKTLLWTILLEIVTIVLTRSRLMKWRKKNSRTKKKLSLCKNKKNPNKRSVRAHPNNPSPHALTKRRTHSLVLAKLGSEGRVQLHHHWSDTNLTG